MIWFVLSILAGIGVALLMYGMPEMPPFIAMACGAEIVLGCLWLGVREQMYKKAEAETGDIFFGLNIPALKEAMHYWGDSWADVRKIILYPAPVGLPSVGGKTIKYILHWKCSNVNKVIRVDSKIRLHS